MRLRPTSIWPGMAARGVAAVVLGLLLLFWPAPTLETVRWIFGIFALVEGFAALSSSLYAAHLGSGVKWGMFALGLIGILAGIVNFVSPRLPVLYVIGVWAIAAGVTEIVTGMALRREMANHEWLLILIGVVALAFGLILVIAPSSALLAFTSYVGFFGLVYGALQLLLAFRLRSAAQAERP